MGLVSKRSEDDEPVEVRILGFGGLELPGDDDLVIDLADWTDAGRLALRERLETLAVPHVWEDLSLVVDPDQESWVERIIEQVEDELSTELDPDAEQIAYDLAGWDQTNRDLLVAAMEDEAIAYGIDGDELVVHEIDERRVDELVDAIVAPDAPPAPGGEARAEVMGDLFVAADRLARNPLDAEGRIALAAGTEAATASAPPYGMDQTWWEATGTACDALIERLTEVPLDHDVAIEEAAALRDRLRPYV